MFPSDESNPLSPSQTNSSIDLPSNPTSTTTIPDDLGKDLVSLTQARGSEFIILGIGEEEIVSGRDGGGSDDLYDIIVSLAWCSG